MAVREQLRTLKYAAWLGWQIESNWTKPWLFVAYSIAKPISATLILVLMYLVIFSSSLTRPDIFAFMFIGNAFYMYVAQVLFGIVMVIHEDREHYQTLKQIYIAPISFYVYVLGRAVPKIVITTIAILITLAFGVLVLGLDINLAAVNWGLLALAMAVGLMCICMIGIALAGVSFLTAKHGMGINEGHRRHVLPVLRRGLPHHRASAMGAGGRSGHTDHLLARDRAPRRAQRLGGGEHRRSAIVQRDGDLPIPPGIKPHILRDLGGHLPIRGPAGQEEGQAGHDHLILRRDKWTMR